MNRMRTAHKWVFTLLVAAMLTLAVSAPAFAGNAAGYLSLWYSRSGCSYTYTIQYSGINSAKTMEIWMTQNDVRIAPTQYQPVNSKSGTVVYTFPALASSATTNSFRGWAQMLDAHGNPISGTLDFSSIDVSYCAAP